MAHASLETLLYVPQSISATMRVSVLQKQVSAPRPAKPTALVVMMAVLATVTINAFQVYAPAKMRSSVQLLKPVS